MLFLPVFWYVMDGTREEPENDAPRFVLLEGGSLGLGLLMVTLSIEAASSLDGAITPGFSSPPVSFWVFGPWPRFEPTTYPFRGSTAN